jgi:4-hydroxybenzoate polyprenyltransferase
MAGLVRKLLEMVRFSHTVFALPFALASAALAWRTRAEPPRLVEFLGVVLCMVFARSAAMAFNRLVDRRFDAANPRTADRHLPRGTLSVAAVWAFTAVNVGLFFASTLLFLPNTWPVLLAGPVLVFVGAYSLTKRFTALAHFWLGASLMLAPLAAWIALRGPEELTVPGLLGLAVLFWVAGFDVLYACQDADFDRSAGLHSVPAALGVANALRLAAACHALMVLALVGLWWAARPVLGGVFLAGVGGVAALLVYEHSLVRPDDLGQVNRAFFHVNGVISVGLLVVVLVQLALPY